MNEWIDVRDRLPAASAFNPENNSVEVLLWQYGRFELGRIWFKHIDDYEVTHWMPLPEPPKLGRDALQKETKG